MSKTTPENNPELTTGGDTAAELAELREQLAKAQAEKLAAEQEKEQALQAKAEAVTRAETAEQAARSAPQAPQKKAFKAKLVTVISATGYNYLLEDNVTRITPNAPVKAERAPGNLLDALMDTGSVVEFES